MSAPGLAHLAVLQPQTGEILLVDGALPTVPSNKQFEAGTVLGREVFVLRTLHRAGDDRVVAVEDMASPSVPLPPGGEWVAQGDAAARSPYGDALAEWFTELVEGEPEERWPWAKRGWLPDTLAWVDDVLASAGRRRLPGVTQLKQWSLSAVLLVPTDGGDVVLKQAPQILRGEGPAIAWLEALAPGHVPHVLGVDRTAGRFLMDAFVADERSVEPDGLVTLARIQSEAAPRVDELLALGCEDRRLDSFADEVQRLAARTDLLFSAWELASTDSRRPTREVTDDDVAALAGAGTELARRIDVLRGAGVPESVVHGDFHVHNVVWSRGTCLLFDWSHVAVSHPWFDLPMWLMWGERPAESLEGYLAAWSTGGDDLAAVWEVARPLALLYHAGISRDLADAMTERQQSSDWAAAVQKLVLQALEAMGQG